MYRHTEADKLELTNKTDTDRHTHTCRYRQTDRQTYTHITRICTEVRSKYVLTLG